MVSGDSTEPPLLAMHGVHKSFPGVRALKDVSLTLHAGEVLALVGENGAGKSTLIKVLGGAHEPDAGTMQICGRERRIKNPVEARHAGINIIYQEFNTIPGLTACENIFLGREQSRFGLIPAGAERAQAAALFGQIGLSIDPETPCRELSVAQQQGVEIARALALDARIIVMDEPSATLTPQEVARLFKIIRDLQKRGLGLIYVSHRLDEIFQIADRVMVMRDGEHVATRPVSDVSRDELIELMVGRRLDQEFPKERLALGEPRFVVENLSRQGIVNDVSFHIRRGEVLGLTGLVGAGRTEVARLIFGADRRDSGVCKLDGRVLAIRNPRDAMRAGICLLTEDRKSQGLILNQSVRENFGLPNLPHWSVGGWMNHGAERRACDGYVGSLRIRLHDREEAAANLSGGNQQKVVLAKWLEHQAEVVMFDEPTRGIDVGGKYEIYLLMNALARAGKSILMISSELPEVLGMSDRVLVMHQGRTRGEIEEPWNATQEQVLRLAV